MKWREMRRATANHHENISKISFSQWKPPGVSERMWRVFLHGSISGEYQTLEGHFCRPSE
jgi:hypothetical protein